MNTWILPAVTLPKGGKVRSVGRFDRRAYDRAYYHAKRKGRTKQATPTPEQVARRNALAVARYHANLERSRAEARARYWKHRDRYAAAARERARARRARG